jgi:hypothetical protein
MKLSCKAPTEISFLVSLEACYQGGVSPPQIVGHFKMSHLFFFMFFSCDTSLIRNMYQHILQTSYKVPDMERLLLTAPTIVT